MKIKKIIIVVAIVIVGICIIMFINKKNYNKNDILIEKIDYKIDDDTGEYVVLDENQNEIGRVDDEARIQIYRDDPSYNPNPTY